MMDASDVVGDSPQPLAGVRVVEISFLESVCYAGVLLAQLGAEVVKVEPPTGDPMRRREPLAPRADGNGTVSLPFEFLNAGKASYVYRADSTGEMRQLIRKADVVVVDHRTLGQIGLTLPDRREGQLRVFVGLFGGAPDKAVNSSALTRLHASTTGYIVPADIDTTRRPAWTGPYIFECMHGVGLSVAITAELLRPEGGDVDYSLQTYGLWLDKLLFSRTSTSKLEIHRHTAPYPYGGNIACQDGFIALLVLEEHQWRGFCRMIDRPEWVEDERFQNGVLRNRNRAPLAEGLNEWCARHTVAEVLAKARSCDVPAGLCRSPQDVLDAKVAKARGFFVEGDSAFGAVRFPTLPFGPAFRGKVASRAPELDR